MSRRIDEIGKLLLVSGLNNGILLTFQLYFSSFFVPLCIQHYLSLISERFALRGSESYNNNLMSQFALHDCNCTVDICIIRCDPLLFKCNLLIPLLSTEIVSLSVSFQPSVLALPGEDSVPYPNWQVRQLLFGIITNHVVLKSLFRWMVCNVMQGWYTYLSFFLLCGYLKQ